MISCQEIICMLICCMHKIFTQWQPTFDLVRGEGGWLLQIRDELLFGISSSMKSSSVSLGIAVPLLVNKSSCEPWKLAAGLKSLSLITPGSEYPDEDMSSCMNCTLKDELLDDELLVLEFFRDGNSVLTGIWSLSSWRDIVIVIFSSVPLIGNVSLKSLTLRKNTLLYTLKGN